MPQAYAPVLCSQRTLPKAGGQPPVVVSEAGQARFLFARRRPMQAIQHDIEALLAERAPDVEVLLAEVIGDTVRLFIDHPEGVTLELCERVTHLLPEVREEFALEVSSPGPKRPLSKPDHFRRYLGRRARVRSRVAVDDHES